MSIPLIVLFFWNEQIDTGSKIDNGKFGTFGDFFGGVFGSIWSLAGVILFYLALKEQRTDFKTNSNALIKQVEALEIQTEEFKLQREELTQTRNVFIEQSLILKQQRFENTYFSLLELFSSIFSELNNRCADGDFFGKIKSEMKNRSCPLQTENGSTQLKHYIDVYREIVHEQKESAAHYFKLFYRMVKLIDDSDISVSDKFLYMKIFRSQLSEDALLITYYNSHCPESRSLYKLILKYNLLKHLPKQEKLEFKAIVSQSKNTSNLEYFNNLLEERTINFLSDLNSMLRSDDFESHSISYVFEGVTVRIKSDDDIILEFHITNNDPDKGTVLGFDYHDFCDYFLALMYDLFVNSQYVPCQDINIDIERYENTEIIKIESQRPIKLTSDTI
ncbi:putative phage abortive infection protein [Vibrio splendidus]|uniref:putative phage abortive infection protein n=1 Tax=Vibrio splendidus TaxID=29497 RepID=UPI00223680AA|nr:putative phage abortive infection protein [Vibrio splendidus]MCW4439432.1 putative phage abortive infection protein [Vibrio splendidus]